MKEIKEEIIKKEYKTRYQAIDGEMFDTPEECRKYENTALAVVKSKYNKLVVKTTDAYTMTIVGSEEDKIELVKVKTKEECDIVKQMFILINHIDTNKEFSDWEKRFFDRVDSALKTKDILLIGRGYEGDCFFSYGTKKEYLKTIEKTLAVEEPEQEYKEPEYGGC